MKNKIFAVILTICLLFSTMSMTALANETVTDEIVNDNVADIETIADEIVLQEIEDEEMELLAAGVTATVGSSDLAGATDIALSFKSTITLPQSIAEDTDLSGIVFTGGETDLAPASISKGEVIGGTFNKIDIVTPVLANGTEYTLVIPALGANEAANISFTTVEGPYFVKEDLNDRYNATWLTYLGRHDLLPEWYFADSNGDGSNDMMVGVGGDSHHTVWLPTPIPLDTVNEFVVETRVRYIANNKAALEDGSLPDDNDDNNGGLLTVRGNNADNNSFEVRTDADGYLTYGGSFGRGIDDTNYKIYNNKWYTIRIAFDDVEGRAKVFITDDEGNKYQGDWANARYGSYQPINPLTEIRLSYGQWYMSDVDYVYAWANDDLGDISATYDNGTPLDGAKNLPGTSIDATLRFENDVTLDQLLSVLKINDGATLTPTLVDSKTVALRISNLHYETNYVLDVPLFGNNKAKTFTFKTEATPLDFEADEFSFALADGTSSTALTNVRTDAYVEYEFDAALLALNPNAYKNIVFTDEFNNAVTINCTLGENSKYVAYPTKGLKYGTKYIFKCPTSQTSAEGATLYKVMTFTTEAAPFIANAYPVAIAGSNVIGIASITDNTGLNNQIKAMLVVYDAQGQIIKVTAQDIALTPGVNNINLMATVAGADTAKLYIWGGVNGMSNLVSVQ